MDAARLAHSRRTGGIAAQLAPAWGVDPERARLAGLLHDWGRCLDDAGILAEAERLGVAVGDVARRRPLALLHAPVGAAQLAEEGLSDVEILHAVARHTVGAADMTALEALVYVADYCEPGRTHAPAAPVRRVARTDPHGALALAVQATLVHLAERTQPIDECTVAMWNGVTSGTLWTQWGGAS